MTQNEKIPYLYGLLNKSVRKVDILIEGMMHKHEADFISAYRGHMLRVQQELLLIKKTISEQQFKMKLDSRVNTLQKSLNWFKEEAMNLSKIVEQKSNHIKQIQGEYNLIKNEIGILTEALKKSKKEI
jgi:uncharacterized protein YlxW (UPF0749 family)